MFRLLVSGSREWDQPEVLEMVLTQFWIDYGDDLVIVHGDCPSGADRIARDWAHKHGVPDEPHPADWNKHGKAAGHIRNKEMVDTNPHGAVFFFRGPSRGTKNCFDHAVKAGIPYVAFGDRP